MAMIELKNITFRYDRASAPVFENFGLSVESGECICVNGENGSGKTTLFRIINGLSFPQEGDYFFEGTKITADYLRDNSNSKLFHKHIGYLFQNTDVMLFNPRVYEEIAFGPRQMGLSESEVEARVSDCMRIFDIAELSDKAPYHLSGGQKKRVALAAVMALNPVVLVLDEPYAGLDKKNKSLLTAFLLELKGAGKTIIIADHERKPISDICDREILLGEET